MLALCEVGSKRLAFWAGTFAALAGIGPFCQTANSALERIVPIRKTAVRWRRRFMAANQPEIRSGTPLEAREPPQ